ncbi:hypothetical protein [Paenibacillus thalictri]|nr:hypothetical protein [Paenibacillus thalictri]
MAFLRCWQSPQEAKRPSPLLYIPKVYVVEEIFYKSQAIDDWR